MRGELAEFIFEFEIEDEDYWKMKKIMMPQDSKMIDYESKSSEEKQFFIKPIVQHLSNSFYRSGYNSEEILNRIYDLQLLTGYIKKPTKIAKGLNNNMMMMCFSYVFDLEQIFILLKRMSKGSYEEAYNTSLMKQVFAECEKQMPVDMKYPFDSNFVKKDVEVIYQGDVEANKSGEIIYDIKGGNVCYKGKPIKDLPDRNFEISLEFTTKMSDCGIFSIDFNGHDRHICLKGGKMYIRVWKGGGWNAHTDKQYNDNKWHKVVLTVEAGVGQTLYVDDEKVGTNAYDHSDFDWKERLFLGYSAD